MDRLTQRYEMLKKALNSLDEILHRIENLTPTHINYLPFRDSTIQRFEYSVDTFWKFLREYLEKKYGTTVVGSPKSVIKTATELEIISIDDYPHFITIIDDRRYTKSLWLSCKSF